MDIKKEFEIGDKIIVSNWYNTYAVQVTRLTKTQAVCRYTREDGTSYDMKFKKSYSVYYNENGEPIGFRVTKLPLESFTQTKYRVIPFNNENGGDSAE